MKAIDFINPKAKYRDILYSRWVGIRERCNQPSDPNYKNYGGRGIKVCSLWNDSKYGFANFYSWAMCKHFLPELTIERIDFNGNYEPSNCCWIPRKDQIHNRRCSIRIWDNDKYISMKTYCNLHKDTNPYSNALRWIKKGVPPYIALYHKFTDSINKAWLHIHKYDLYSYTYQILHEHPNLIEDTDIQLDKYVHKYLYNHIEDYKEE